MEQVMPLFGYRTQTRALLAGGAVLNVPGFLYRELSTWHRIVFLYTHKVLQDAKQMQFRAKRRDLLGRLVKVIEDQEGHRLAGDVEAAKIVLSEKSEAAISLEYVERGLTAMLSRERFEADTSELRERMVRKIDECLGLAGVKRDDISTLFLTGGTTAVPTISTSCREAVPHALVVAGDRFGSVGTGLAIDAGVRFRVGDGQADNVELKHIH
jgi:hypothetical chaperone protein